MEKRTRNILITVGILAVAGLSLGLYVAIKKKKNSEWRLLKLTPGSKKGTKFKIIRNN